MALLIEALAHPPARDGIALEPLAEAHREPLRIACAEDDSIWDIYPSNWTGAAFDGNFDQRLAERSWLSFAILEGDRLIGMTSYINPDPARGITEIGGTYIRPSARGTGFNDRLKRLMIKHAFACGIRRIEFRIDDRNGRSKAAVAKIGGIYEGLMRKDRVTWTGHVRNTALFSILREEWECDSGG